MSIPGSAVALLLAQSGSNQRTVDYLVVAGGASGGSVHGGGGGAGGYRNSVTGESSGANSPAETALSLVLGTSYTVTVGAGGALVNSGPGLYGNNGTSFYWVEIRVW